MPRWYRFRMLLWLLPLLLSALACNYVTQLIIPPTPVPTATLIPTQTATVEPTVPSPTATLQFEAACPALLSEVLSAATSDEDETEPITLHRDVADDHALRYLVRYSLRDDRLVVRSEIFLPDGFDPELDARATHERIWNYFAALIPPGERDFLSAFSVMTDGSSRILGGVRRSDEDPDQWELRIDVLDARDPRDLTYTLLHEFGHLLTLKSSQVTFDRSVYFDPDNAEAYERARSACPTYFSEDGCSAADSYLNEFFIRYWSTFFEEWQQINQARQDESYRDRIYQFYKTYADQFLTDYAATGPEEDIAESWAFFVLSPKPELSSIADEKILFFYEYPELVQLRQEILTQLCLEYPQ